MFKERSTVAQRPIISNHQSFFNLMLCLLIQDNNLIIRNTFFAHLKTVALIKEAIKVAFFRLVESLVHHELWV